MGKPRSLRHADGVYVDVLALIPTRKILDGGTQGVSHGVQFLLPFL
jgi:hypothetical protein